MVGDGFSTAVKSSDSNGSSRASLVTQMLKNPLAMHETWVWSLGQEDLLEKGMAAHSSALAWRIPRTEEPGGLQSTGLQRVGHDWVANTSLSRSSSYTFWKRGLFPRRWGTSLKRRVTGFQGESSCFQSSVKEGVTFWLRLREGGPLGRFTWNKLNAVSISVRE